MRYRSPLPSKISAPSCRFQTHSWSPDGGWIAFDSLEHGGAWHVYVMDSSGGRRRRVTVDSADENVPSWSPDGPWIYFTSNRTGRTEM